MPRHFRLLPTVVIAAATLFGVKAANLWLGFDDFLNFRLPQAHAAAGEKADATAKEGAAADIQTTTAPAKKGLPVTDKEVIDPSNYSKSEIEILQNLGQRREELERRGRELDMRENLLGAAEQRVEQKIAELKKIEATISALIRQHGDQEEKQMTSLVVMYEKMKPKDAARILEQLDMVVLVDVFERMKEAKMAPIMAAMDSAKAKALTMELATRRKLPEAAGQAKG